MAARDRLPIDEHWQAVHRALLNKIAYRERELLELHEDYLDLELRCNGLMAFIRRQAARDRAEIAARKALDAANDAAVDLRI